MNKNTFRYYPSFIFTFILIVSILITIVSLHFVKINFFEKLEDNFYEIHLQTLESIRKSRFDKGYSQKTKNEFIDYVISRKEKNTTDYVIYRDKNNKLEFKDDRELKKLTDESNIHISTNISDIQLNDKNFLPSKNMDPSWLTDKRLWIKGTFAKGKLMYDTNLHEFSGLRRKIGMTFISAIRNDYKHMTEKYYEYSDKGYLTDDEIDYNKVVSHDFYYAIDLDNASLMKIIKNREIATNFIAKSILTPIIAAIIMMFLVVFTNYYKNKEHKTFEGITNIPIELYLFFLLVLYSFFATNIDFFTHRGIKLFTEYPISQYISIFLLCVVSMVYAGYFIMIAKSLYYDGLKSFLIQQSIFVKAFTFILKMIGKVINGVIQFFVGISLVNKVVLLGIYLFGLLLIYAVVNVVFGNSFMFVPLSVVFTYIMYRLKRYLDHINEIEKVTEEISIGNYKVKVDEENNIFKKVAKNINHITKSLSLAVDKELKSERLKTELITNVSHDLKTPLTSIINYSGLINEESTKDEDIKKYAKVINEKSKKLKVLIENLFELSKATSKNIKLNIQSIDFKEVVNQIAGEWSDKFKEKNLNLILTMPKKDVCIDLDGQQTSRILDNIFSNIYKYALDGTRVYVDLVSKESTILEVKNISKYPLNISSEDLMERFTRGDESRNTEGSGLGLSIAKQLTTIQNGTFDIEILGDVFVVKLEF